MKTIDYNSDDPQNLSGPQTIPMLILKLITLMIITLVSIPLWPLYWLGRLIWYRPPNTPHWAQALRYLRFVWTVNPPAPGMSTFMRVWHTLGIVQKVLMTPIWGLMWLMDELLYGRKINAIEVNKPLLFISAGRSGSTQMGLYLAEDEQFAAPNLLQSMFPYLWLWKLLPRIVGRFMTKDKVREKVRATMPAALLERHEGDPFTLDTFDGAFFSAHFNGMALQLGPDVAVTEFGFGKFPAHDRQMWEEDFVTLVDRVARKTLLLVGSAPDGESRRFLIKGHFLAGADVLERKYPDACFLTIIREPAPRVRSGINYLRVNPSDPVLGPVPWPWLAATFERTEVEYCEVEQDWFTRTGGAKRCVIRFSDFVKDLAGSMQKVYRECCDMDTVPAHIPTEHAPRAPKHYSVNRTLAELGIDETALNKQLASYIAWCRKQE
jgi:hypothetical protein